MLQIASSLTGSYILIGDFNENVNTTEQSSTIFRTIMKDNQLEAAIPVSKSSTDGNTQIDICFATSPILPQVQATYSESYFSYHKPVLCNILPPMTSPQFAVVPLTSSGERTPVAPMRPLHLSPVPSTSSAIPTSPQFLAESSTSSGERTPVAPMRPLRISPVPSTSSAVPTFRRSTRKRKQINRMNIWKKFRDDVRAEQPWFYLKPVR